MRLKALSQLIVLILVVFSLASFGGTAEPFKIKPINKSPNFNQIVADEIIVKFKGGVSEGDIEAINNGFGTKVKKSNNKQGKFKVIKIKDNQSPEKMVAKYQKHKKVEYAEVNSLCFAQAVPNDPYYRPYQWHFDNSDNGGIQMEKAWDITSGDSEVIVAILDTGVAYERYGGAYRQAPDLAETMFVPGYDFINDDTHPNDDNAHGTHVCGTVAQSTNNGIGVAGIASNTAIMPVKVLDAAGSGTAASLAYGLRFAADNGADVINMSLSWPPGYNPGETVREAIAYAYNSGVTLIAAAGNDSTGTVCYPAAYDDYVIAVGATRYDEHLAYYSNWGSSLDVTAPGGDVTVDQNGDGNVDGVLQQTFAEKAPKAFGYYLYQGTSMASPHVAGVAALLIANGTIGPDNVRAALENTAEDKGSDGFDYFYGHGIINAFSALLYNVAPPENHPPVANTGGPYVGEVDVEITFDGSGSTDPDPGDTLTYEWDFSGTAQTGVTATHTYSMYGTHDVSLTVTDTDGLSDTSFTTVEVLEDVNEAPFADTGGSYVGEVDVEITFDGSGSTDPDPGDTLTYEWTFGDDTTGEGVKATHTYSTYGEFDVSLTVTDTDGLFDTSFTTVTIIVAPFDCSVYNDQKTTCRSFPECRYSNKTTECSNR